MVYETDPGQTEIDIKTVAQTLWGEARDEGIDGMTDVADVIGNRVAIARAYVEQYAEDHPLFGDGTFDNCCKRPWQFSCWNYNDPNRAKLLSVTTDDPQFAQAEEIATQAVKGLLVDETKGATHYYAEGSPMPAWAEGLEPCFIRGRHLFFNNVK